MEQDNFYMIAKTMYGLEEVLANELKMLGAQKIKIFNRAVSFKGDTGFLYKVNLNLRTALRVLKPIQHFQANDEKDLYRKLCLIDWTGIFKLDKTFSTSASTNSTSFPHSKYASLVLKDAIVDTFRKKFKQRPNIDPKNSDIKFDIHINKNTCTVSLDSSGQSLHKRGYKIESVPAPINEVLAAGIILLSDWDKKANFHDPMCGSGTMLIEAALIAYNIPANIFRKKFCFQHWNDYDQNLWEKIKDVSLNKETNYNGKITGSDICLKSISTSRKNIKNALFENNIKISKENFFTSRAPKKTFILFNPPYGERLNINISDFYAKIGTTLKHNCVDTIVWLISSDLDNIRYIGLKPQKKIKLFNGPLECSLRKFEIYDGSKKTKKSN